MLGRGAKGGGGVVSVETTKVVHFPNSLLKHTHTHIHGDLVDNRSVTAFRDQSFNYL